jgi:CRP-like cAMP-binding protein
MDVALHNPVAACLATCPLFIQVEWQTIQLLAEEAKMSRMDRGQAIFQSGNHKSGLFLVKSGQVKLSILSPNGSERVIDVVLPGGTFGESILFSNQKTKLNAEMLAKGDLIEIPQDVVRKAVKNCPTLASAMLQYMSSKICRLLGELENCCLRSARQRVVDYLLMLAKEQSNMQRDQILLPASKGVTASLLDITPETFSRELNRLMGQGLIEVARNHIRIIDLQAMRQASAVTI